MVAAQILHTRRTILGRLHGAPRDFFSHQNGKGRDPEYCVCSMSAKGRREMLHSPRRAMHSREKTSRGDTWRAHVTSTECPAAWGGAHGTRCHTRGSAATECAGDWEDITARRPSTWLEGCQRPTPTHLDTGKGQPRGKSSSTVMGLRIGLAAHLNSRCNRDPTHDIPC